MRTVAVPLHAVAHARAGDKGNRSNISVIPYLAEAFPYLVEQVTEERVLGVFGHKGATAVRRYVLPRLPAINFVIDNALEGGVNSSLCLDGHGKRCRFCCWATSRCGCRWNASPTTRGIGRRARCVRPEFPLVRKARPGVGRKKTRAAPARALFRLARSAHHRPAAVCPPRSGRHQLNLARRRGHRDERPRRPPAGPSGPGERGLWTAPGQPPAGVPRLPRSVRRGAPTTHPSRVAGILLVFNPLLPIHLRRDTWRVVDLVAATLFLGVALRLQEVRPSRRATR